MMISLPEPGPTIRAFVKQALWGYWHSHSERCLRSEPPLDFDRISVFKIPYQLITRKRKGTSPRRLGQFRNFPALRHGLSLVTRICEKRHFVLHSTSY